MKKHTSDLGRSIASWKKKNPDLAETFDQDYDSFKIGILLKQAREDAGLSQTELAELIQTKRTAISRLENRAQDVKLSTIEKVAHALGKHLELRIAETRLQVSGSRLHENGTQTGPFILSLRPVA